ncbi:MAG: ImuA family protein [Alphaproteobacteria bacterium]
MSSVATLVALQDRIRRIERPGALRHGVLPFRIEAIDRVLPGGGLALGAVHEFLGIGADEEDGAAVAGFAAGIAGRIAKGNESGLVLWCLKQGDLYAPGVAEHGLDPARIVRVIAPRDDDILWVLEEGLRTAGIAAVVGEVGKLPMVAGRRLQLAAERSGVTALLLRRWRNGAEAASERERPSAAVTRWRIAAIPSLPGPELNNEPGIGTPRWRVELLRCRGAEAAQVTWDVEVADASGLVSVPAGLADRPAAPRRLAAKPGLQRAAG